MEYYSALKGKEFLSHATMSINPEESAALKTAVKSMKSFYIPITMTQGEALPFSLQYLSHTT